MSVCLSLDLPCLLIGLLELHPWKRTEKGTINTNWVLLQGDVVVCPLRSSGVLRGRAVEGDGGTSEAKQSGRSGLACSPPPLTGQ